MLEIKNTIIPVFPTPHHCKDCIEAVDEALALCGLGGGMIGTQGGRVSRRPLREGREAAWSSNTSTEGSSLGESRRRSWCPSYQRWDSLKGEEKIAGSENKWAVASWVSSRFSESDGNVDWGGLAGNFDPLIPFDMDWTYWEWCNGQDWRVLMLGFAMKSILATLSTRSSFHNIRTYFPTCTIPKSHIQHTTWQDDDLFLHIRPYLSRERFISTRSSLHSPVLLIL